MPGKLAAGHVAVTPRGWIESHDQSVRTPVVIVLKQRRNVELEGREHAFVATEMFPIHPDLAGVIHAIENHPHGLSPPMPGHSKLATIPPFLFHGPLGAHTVAAVVWVVNFPRSP